MEEEASRTAMILGEDAIAALSKKRVAVFGCGGVGGYAIEALARTGVGHFLLVDGDEVSPSNLNRQILASVETIGKRKVEVAKARILSIHPKAEVEIKDEYYLPEKRGDYDFSSFDYVLDAVDMVSAKVDLALACLEAGTPIVSSMGTGNKVDPSKLMVTDLSKTEGDPLAKAVRTRLRKLGVNHLKVVFSSEASLAISQEGELAGQKKRSPGSLIFVPAAAGLLLARTAVFDLLQNQGK